MKCAGYGEALDKKGYYEFLKILCGIERIDDAVSVFGKMKEDACYDLLIQKLYVHGCSDKANGVAIERKEYKVEKKATAVKKEKKRETFHEKMARKRRRLKHIRLSFVKKMRRHA
ncbi:hypothetical protein ACS0TY_013348 [Phlomoides rotata]